MPAAVTHDCVLFFFPHVFQVKMVLEKLYENKKIASATHNIYAYRLVVSTYTNLVENTIL